MSLVVKITPNDKGHPPGKLADAELHFTDGALEGMKLIGFAIWERRTGGGRNVTFPARQYAVNVERRSYALLRPITDSDGQRPSATSCWRRTRTTKSERRSRRPGPTLWPSRRRRRSEAARRRIRLGVAMLKDFRELPLLLTADEVASLLRTTRKAIYVMASRQQLPGVTHIRRRMLVRRDDLLHWLDQNRCAPSLKE